MGLINVCIKGAIRYLELNYPERKNGLDTRMTADLLQAVCQANADPECRIIVFTSAGRAYFSSGPDVEGLITLAEHEGGRIHLNEIVSDLNRIILEIFNSAKITIAAIHGYAYGGGLNLMLACDYRIVEQKAKFIENFYHMGVTPDLGSSYFLPRLIGLTRTMELLLTGRLFTASEGVAWGLFHEEAKKRHEMMERVEALCDRFLSGEAGVLFRTKDLLHRSLLSTLTEHLELEKSFLLESFQHPSVPERLRQIQRGVLFQSQATSAPQVERDQTETASTS